MIKDFRAAVRSWFDQHAGLAGWITVLVAIVAALNQISRTVSEFDPIVQQYIKLVRARDTQVNGYYQRQLNDPRLSRMNDFIKMPVDLWPSAESYDAFRKYYDASFTLLETPVDVEDRINGFTGKLEALKKTLDAARR
jgi:hypothetical protein